MIQTDRKKLHANHDPKCSPTVQKGFVISFLIGEKGLAVEGGKSFSAD